MTDDGRGDWKPKPIVFPKKEPKVADDWKPRPISFAPKAKTDDWAPKPVSFPSKQREGLVTNNDKPRPVVFGAPKTEDKPKAAFNAPPKAVPPPQPDAPPRAAAFDTPGKVAPPVSPPLPGPKPATFAGPPKVAPPVPAPSVPRAMPSGPMFSGSDNKIEQQTGRKIKTPEEARFERMVAVAMQKEPLLAARPGFPKRLQNLVDMPPRDIINWGGKSLEINSQISERVAQITRDLTFLEVSRWIDETKTESTKAPTPTGFLDRFKAKSQPPEFYERKLDQIRGTLDQTIVTKIDTAIREIEDLPDTFGMEVLALTVWTESLSDAMAMQIADNRLRILLSVKQGIEMTKQSLTNLNATVTHSIQQIDDLLHNVLPKWKIAFAHQKP